MENRLDRAVGCTLCSAATDFSSFVRSNNPKKDFYSVVRRALDLLVAILLLVAAPVFEQWRSSLLHDISALLGGSPVLTGKNKQEAIIEVGV
jgi:hypothetical protein